MRLKPQRLWTWDEKNVKNGQIMSDDPPSSVPSFVEKVENKPWLFLEDVYSVFTFEPEHNLHSGTSELLEAVMLQVLDPGAHVIEKE